MYASPSAPNRPRLVGDAILLGKNTVLAKRVVQNGCWQLDSPSDEAIAALLSLAYGKSLSPTDPLVASIIEAGTLLARDRWSQAEARLAHLPAPLPDCAEPLALAKTLLASGTRPADLAKAIRRAPLNLRPAPDYSDSLRLTDQGVVLGKGTVIAGLEDRPDGTTGLAVAGREERIIALLSVASGSLAAPEAVMRKFSSASRALAKGNTSLAAITLCQIGQPSLEHQGMAKALTLAETELDRGTDPYELMKGLGMVADAAAWQKSISSLWDESAHPRQPAGCPEGGEFCSSNGAGQQAGHTPVRLLGRTPPGAKDSPVLNHNPPEQVRQTIGDIASKYEGSKKWLFSTAEGTTGANTYKCNAFVADVLEESGIPVDKVHDTWLHEAPPTAGDWGNPNVDIPGWETVHLAPNEQPQVGDVIAERHPFAEALGTVASIIYPGTATGHVGIIVRDQDGNIKTASVDSTKGGIVTVGTWGLRPAQQGSVTVRRYIGKTPPA